MTTQPTADGLPTRRELSRPTAVPRGDRCTPAARPARIGVWVLACLAMAGACASNSSSDIDVAGAYAHIVEWVAGRSSPDSDRPVVFVVALGEGFAIDLELQAAIVSDSSDDVDVRFIDDRTEAFDDGDVRDGGVLLALGPAEIDGRDVDIEGEEVRGADDLTTWRFELQADDEWSFVAPPSSAVGD